MIVLETKRLILKPISLANLDEIYALRSDPEVMKWVGDGNVQTKDQVEAFIKLGPAYFDQYGMDFFSVFEKSTGDFVGQAGLFHLGFDLNQPEVELAYRLHKKYWGLGYATELAIALVEYGFQKLSLPKIIALHHPDNLASKRVIEKTGMHPCGMMNYKGNEYPCYEIFSKDKAS